jgi:AcrR family transcriptional regulator
MIYQAGAPDRGPDPRAVRSRAAALTSARQLLVEQGPAAVTHVAVAEHSGVGRTTLYRHWPDAAMLLRDAAAQLISIAHTAPAGDLRADLLAELEAARDLLHDPMVNRGIRVIIERSSVDPVFTEIKETLYQAGSEVLRSIVETGKADGALPATLDTDLAVAQLAGPLMYRVLLAGSRITTTQVGEVVDAFLRAYWTTPTGPYAGAAGRPPTGP